MQFNIKVDASEALKHLNDVAKKQLPFACSLALNRSSEKARDKFVEKLPQKITLRTSWWKPKNKWGFNVRNSNKHNLTAVVYTRAPWMSLHETGGLKTPQKKAIAVPTSYVKTTKRGLISKANKPAGMKNKFIKDGIIFKRMKKSIRPMYSLTPSARIKAVLGFKTTIAKEVNRVWPDEFNKAFNEAKRTAK